MKRLLVTCVAIFVMLPTIALGSPHPTDGLCDTHAHRYEVQNTFHTTLFIWWLHQRACYTGTGGLTRPNNNWRTWVSVERVSTLCSYHGVIAARRTQDQNADPPAWYRRMRQVEFHCSGLGVHAQYQPWQTITLYQDGRWVWASGSRR